MPQDYNGSEVQPSGSLKTCSNKCRADTFALVLRRYRHGSESHDFEVGVSRQKNGREHDVAHDRSIFFCNQRNNRSHLFSQSVNKISLGWSFEG